MNEMNGLAGQMQPQQGMQEQDIVAQVVQMLQNGITPEELMAKGVPQEVIMQAMQVLEQQMQPQIDGMQGLAAQQQGMM